MIDLPHSAETAKGIGLPVHNYGTPHRNYNKVMEEALNNMWTKAQLNAWTPAQTKQALFKLAHQTRYTIAQTGKLIAR